MIEIVCHSSRIIEVVFGLPEVTTVVISDFGYIECGVTRPPNIPDAFRLKSGGIDELIPYEPPRRFNTFNKRFQIKKQRRK